MCHPRERGDPEFPPGQVFLSRTALTILDARVREHDEAGSYKRPAGRRRGGQRKSLKSFEFGEGK